jgi:hypothetical protein
MLMKITEAKELELRLSDMPWSILIIKVFDAGIWPPWMHMTSTESLVLIHQSILIGGWNTALEQRILEIGAHRVLYLSLLLPGAIVFKLT